jgi:hypothetical protein
MFRKTIYISICFIFSVWLGVQQAWAQCAMCRTTIENNISQGESESLGAGLNTGILLLLFAPYIIIGVIGVLWYNKSKENAKKIRASRPLGS